MNREFEELCIKVNKMRNIKRCAKALYLVSNEGIADMFIYLDTMVENEYITEEEEDKIVDEISKECAHIYCYRIEEFKKHMDNL